MRFPAIIYRTGPVEQFLANYAIFDKKKIWWTEITSELQNKLIGTQFQVRVLHFLTLREGHSYPN